MGGERERQAQRRRELGAEQARPQDPDRNLEAGPGYGLNALARLRRLEIALQLDDVLREAVDVADQGPPQGMGDGQIAARRPAETEIDPAGKQRFQGAELLGDDERRVVRQHDAARADADRRGAWATCAITTAVAALAIPGMLWCSASQ